MDGGSVDANPSRVEDRVEAACGIAVVPCLLEPSERCLAQASFEVGAPSEADQAPVPRCKCRATLSLAARTRGSLQGRSGREQW